MKKITFKPVQGGNSGAHGLLVQLNTPAAGSVKCCLEMHFWIALRKVRWIISYSLRGLETRLRFCSSSSRLVSPGPQFGVSYIFFARLLPPTVADQGLEAAAVVVRLVQPGGESLRRNYSHLPPTTQQPYQRAFLLSRPTSTNFKTSNRSGSSAVCLRVHFHSSCRSSRGET